MQNANTAYPANIRRFVLTTIAPRIRAIWSPSPRRSGRRSSAACIQCRGWPRL